MKNITRSFESTSCNVTVYNRDKKSLETVSKVLSGKYEDNDAVTKELAKAGIVALDVDNIKVVNELRGMPVADFIRYGAKFESRSKDTRNLITKQIDTKMYTVKVYDRVSKQIIDTDVTADDEKQIAKNIVDNYTLLEIVSCKVTSAIYGMTELDFMNHSEPMVDHFHYIKK